MGPPNKKYSFVVGINITEKCRGNFLDSFPGSIFHFCLLILNLPIEDPPN
jgi:hypothetical protein